MNGEMQRLLAVTRARDRLRKAAFSRAENQPKEIAFAADWLHEFQALKDAELFCPTSQKATGSSFWGVPLVIRDDLGPRALVTFADGASETVQLEPQ